MEKLECQEKRTSYLFILVWLYADSNHFETHKIVAFWPSLSIFRWHSEWLQCQTVVCFLSPIQNGYNSLGVTVVFACDKHFSHNENVCSCVRIMWMWGDHAPIAKLIRFGSMSNGPKNWINATRADEECDGYTNDDDDDVESAKYKWPQQTAKICIDSENSVYRNANHISIGL